MVTTFSPPARPKKPKKNITPIALGALCAVLLLGLIYFFTQANNSATKVGILSEGVLSVAQASGSETFTEETLSDAASTTDGLSALAAEISGKMANAERVRGELEQAQAGLNQAQAALTDALAQLNDATSSIDGVRRDLATRTSELNALRQSSSEEAARLQGVIKDLESQIQDLEEQVASAGGDVQDPVEAAAASEAEPVATETTAEAPAEAQAEKTPAKKSQAAVVPEGGSRTFKTVRYDTRKSTLTFITVDDQVLTYKNVPEEAYEALIAAPVFDVYYRFRIMDVYESQPNDRELMLSIKR